eukprot:CFRG8449T1
MDMTLYGTSARVLGTRRLNWHVFVARGDMRVQYTYDQIKRDHVGKMGITSAQVLRLLQVLDIRQQTE